MTSSTPQFARPKATTLARKKKYGPTERIKASKSWGTWSLAAVASFAIFLLRLQATVTPVLLVVEYIFLLVITAFVLAHSSVSMARRVGIKSPNSGTQAKSSLREGLKRRNLWLAGGGVIIVIPWVHSFVQRTVFGGAGEATELVWLAMLQTAALWQASVSTTARQDWISFLLSCFLMLFGVTTSDRVGMIYIVVPFGFMAAWWLLHQYWQSVARGFVAKSTVPLVRLRLGIMALLVCLTGLLGLVAWSSGGVVGALDGFMPTSGGKGGSDPAARQGVGDGDMLVAAKDKAYSFGPVESDLFLDSQSPSLYDIATEVYGETAPLKREYSRAIALDQDTKVGKDQGIESKKQGREFSAMRKPVDKAMASLPKSSSSKAVLQLIGSTPVHLAQQCYDHFDGIQWTQSNDLDLQPFLVTPQLDAISQKPWMKIANHQADLTWSVRERITLKVINLKTNRVATPPLVTHIHIDKVDQPDFFRWSSQGQLLMPGQPYIPQLTVLHLLHQVPCLHSMRDSSSSLSKIAKVEFPQGGGIGKDERWKLNYLQLPENCPDLDVATETLLKAHDPNLMERWTDWQKIEGLTDALRDQITVDPKSVPSEDAEEVISHVLKTKKAPDYLIASTACMLIRNLGVPCRLVNGFYARPERFDLKSSIAEILPEDLHTWAEVYCHGSWIPIDPCGTYDKPREHRTWLQWAVVLWWGWRDWVMSNPLSFVVGLVTACVAIALRKRMVNSMASALAVLSFPLSNDFRVGLCLRLLRFRRWIFGRQLPARWTLGQWLASDLRAVPSLSEAERQAFQGYAQRRAYASEISRQQYLENNATTVNKSTKHIILQGLIDLFRLG
ncbi:MAG: transglutaminase-like domain-containing protein [Pirellula sp.]|nr:transglutaminase-like domain-containing protein [Pirellula sp.]